MKKIDKNILKIIKLWCEIEGIENIDFKMYSHDRGGVRIENLYKVFSDNRNYSTHIVFTVLDIYIEEGTYNIKDFEKFGDEE